MKLLFNIHSLDYNNVYMIKKISNYLFSEFNINIESNNKKEANYIKTTTELLYDKIKLNEFWANKVNIMLLEMVRKLNGN